MEVDGAACALIRGPHVALRRRGALHSLTEGLLENCAHWLAPTHKTPYVSMLPCLTKDNETRFRVSDPGLCSGDLTEQNQPRN